MCWTANATTSFYDWIQMQQDYSYEAEGPSLALQSFYLKAPPVWELGEVQGNLEMLVGAFSEPPRPPGGLGSSARPEVGGPLAW